MDRGLMMKLIPPIRIDEYVEIPKHLFPYNEEWLECELVHMLEGSGYFVALEPNIPILREKYLYYEFSGIMKIRRHTVPLKPDILLPHQRIIIEVENFYKIPVTDLFKHAYDYERSTGLMAFVATWKSRELKRHLNERYGEWRIGDRLILVDPLTGELEASDLFYEVLKYGGPEPECDIQIEYPTKGSPTHHRRIQYELFIWQLTKVNRWLSLEIPISRGGKVYAPDKMVLDRRDGFIEWSPTGWWSYALDQMPADAQVDLTSMDGNIIRGYEVKTTKELSRLDDNKSISNRLFRELGVMRISKLFNEIFLCVPILDIGKVVAEVFEEWRSPIGVIALVRPYEFEMCRHPEYMADIRYDKLKIILRWFT